MTVNAPHDARDRTLRQVAWRDLFPCSLLFRSLRHSIRLSVLLLATGGYLTMLIGNWLVGGVLFADSEDGIVQKWHRDALAPVWSVRLDVDADIDVADRNELKALGGAGAPWASLLADPGHFVKVAARAPAIAWWNLTGPVVHLFDPQLSSTGLGYLLFRNAWSVLVWAFFGAAIARLAAHELTKRESRAMASGAAEAVAHYPAQILAPLLAASAVFLVAAPLLLVGLLARMNWVAWTAGILWPVVLLFGLMLAVLVIGLVLAWPLMWATIAVEQSDAFDAVSRMYAYFYQRPLHFAGYGLLVAAMAVVGSIGVHLLAAATVSLTDWAFGWGHGNALDSLQSAGATVEMSPALSNAAAGRSFWLQVVASVAAAYPLGLLWTAAVGTYLLLRLHVDGAQTDEIADDEMDSLQSLPQLTPHESGVPGVSSPAQT